MAKKVVATLKKEGAKGYTKVIKAVKNKETGFYSFEEDIMPSDVAKDFFKK